MEIILIKDVENLGYANDIVTVRPGYANKSFIKEIFMLSQRKETLPECGFLMLKGL